MKRFLAGMAVAMGVAVAGAWSQAAAVQVDAPARWQFAGENQGIRFHFKIAHECREEGAQVEVKLENSLDHAVVVSFRLVDPDWKKSFERELGPHMKDTAIRFTTEEGTACHPFVDEVYVASKETQVTHSESDPDLERMQAPSSPSDLPADPPSE